MSGHQSMDTGRELELLVAEKVFGLKPGPCPGPVEGLEGGYACERCFHCWDWIEPFKAEHDFVPEPYSTSMTSAWKVVEKIGLGIRPTTVPGRPWRSETSEGVVTGFHPALAWEISHPVDFHIVLATHKNPATAICLGALRALELLEGNA